MGDSKDKDVFTADFVRVMMEQEERDAWYRRRRTIVLAAIALVTLAVSTYLFAQVQYREARAAQYAAMLAHERASKSEELEQRTRELVKLRDEVLQLRSAVGGITEVPPEAKVASALAEVTQKADQLGQRLKLLEESILATPDKALSIPLLRKDLENEHATMTTETVAIRQEIARLYDFNKWFSV